MTAESATLAEEKVVQVRAPHGVGEPAALIDDGDVGERCFLSFPAPAATVFVDVTEDVESVFPELADAGEQCLRDGDEA